MTIWLELSSGVSREWRGSNGKVILGIVLVLAIIYIVPFLVYGLGSIVAGLKTPAGVSPAQFLLSVLVSKTGTAFAFVLIFYLARSSLSGDPRELALRNAVYSSIEAA